MQIGGVKPKNDTEWGSGGTNSSRIEGVDCPACFVAVGDLPPRRQRRQCSRSDTTADPLTGDEPRRDRRRTDAVRSAKWGVEHHKFRRLIRLSRVAENRITMNDTWVRLVTDTRQDR